MFPFPCPEDFEQPIDIMKMNPSIDTGFILLLSRKVIHKGYENYVYSSQRESKKFVQKTEVIYATLPSRS